MAIIARIIAVALVSGWLTGVGLGFALVPEGRDRIGVSLISGCVGAIVGAVACAAREIVAAQQQHR